MNGSTTAQVGLQVNHDLNGTPGPPDLADPPVRRSLCWCCSKCLGDRERRRLEQERLRELRHHYLNVAPGGGGKENFGNGSATDFRMRSASESTKVGRTVQMRKQRLDQYMRSQRAGHQNGDLRRNKSIKDTMETNSSTGNQLLVEDSRSSIQRPLSETDLTSQRSVTLTQPSPCLTDLQHDNSHLSSFTESPPPGGSDLDLTNHHNSQDRGHISEVKDSEHHFPAEEDQTRLSRDDGLEGLEEMDWGEGAAPLEHLLEVLQYHPQYLSVFRTTHNHLMYDHGPLSYQHRHYIAIMAASAHRCGYLVDAQSRLFLREGGEKAWLHGISHAPRKLRLLSDVNKLLAHRPWLIKSQHITSLVKDSEDKWTLSELTHALVLLAHFHSLCSFVSGCGITNFVQDSSIKGLLRAQSLSNLNNSNSRSREQSEEDLRRSELDEVLMRMKELEEEEGDKLSEEEFSRRFDDLENLAVQLCSADDRRPAQCDAARFLEDPDYWYEDFPVSRAHAGSNSSKASRDRVHTFLVQEFSWEDQGYSLLDRFYIDAGPLLDDKFNLTRQLTYLTFGGSSDVDTTLYREAVWMFVHCLYGMRHSCYDYSTVSRLVHPTLRSYIKLTACHPHLVTRADYSHISVNLQHSEKVHINLMIMEARMQAELLYGLKALSGYLTCGATTPR